MFGGAGATSSKSSGASMSNKKCAAAAREAGDRARGAAAKRDDEQPDKQQQQAAAAAAAAAADDKAGTEPSRFEGDGVQFKAKLIGSELVMEPRGDKLCQDSTQRLKAIIRGQKAHKRRILLKVSYDGVKVLDERTGELLYHSQVAQISFIASDDSDPRTFGYICDVPAKAHRFVCFKTAGPALQVMSVISSLFEAVLERKRAAEQQPHSALVGELGEGGAPSEPAARSAALDLSEQLGDLLIDGPEPAGWTSAGAPSPPPPPPLVKQSTLSADAPLSVTADSGILDTSASPIARAPALARPASLRSAGLLGPVSRRQPPASSASFAVASAGDDPFAFAGAPAARALVHNASSVSLNEAALTRQSSFGALQQLGLQQQQQHATDKYAVFNDIDSLPSIFESGSALHTPDGRAAAARQPAPPVPRHQQQQHAADSFLSASTAGGFCFGPGPAHAPAPQHWQGAPFAPAAAPPINVPPPPFAPANNLGLNSMVVGSAPMAGVRASHALDHARFSASMVAGGLSQRLGASANSLSSAGSAAGLSRQTNPFDDDFFA